MRLLLWKLPGEVGSSQELSHSYMFLSTFSLGPKGSFCKKEGSSQRDGLVVSLKGQELKTLFPVESRKNKRVSGWADQGWEPWSEGQYDHVLHWCVPSKTIFTFSHHSVSVTWMLCACHTFTGTASKEAPREDPVLSRAASKEAPREGPAMSNWAECAEL